MNTIEMIEEMFGVQITETAHREFQYTGRDLTLECVEGIITQNSGVLEWQDPLYPDCGNGDGVWYLVIKMATTEDDLATEDQVAGEVYETFFCFDPSDKSFSIV